MRETERETERERERVGWKKEKGWVPTWCVYSRREGISRGRRREERRVEFAEDGGGRKEAETKSTGNSSKSYRIT